MRTTLLIPILAMAASGRAILLDDFTTGAYDSGFLTGNGTFDATQVASVPGGIRATRLFVTANPNDDAYRLRINTTLGMGMVSNGVGVDGTARLAYGTTAGIANLDADYLPNPLFRLTFVENDLPNTVTISLTSSTSASTVSKSLLIPGGTTNSSFDYDFTGAVELADVDDIRIDFAYASSADFALRSFEAVPEPASFAVIGTGLIALAHHRRRRR